MELRHGDRSGHKITIREDTAMEKVEYEGETYYFCAAGCRERFEKEPERYSSDELKGWVRGE